MSNLAIIIMTSTCLSRCQPSSSQLWSLEASRERQYVVLLHHLVSDDVDFPDLLVYLLYLQDVLDLGQPSRGSSTLHITTAATADFLDCWERETSYPQMWTSPVFNQLSSSVIPWRSWVRVCAFFSLLLICFCYLYVL